MLFYCGTPCAFHISMLLYQLKQNISFELCFKYQLNYDMYIDIMTYVEVDMKCYLKGNTTIFYLKKVIFTAVKSQYNADAFEPRHEKTYVLVSDQVRHKQGCTATEDC